MKKVLLGSLATLAVGVSLNATVFATVNGENVTDKDVSALLRSIPGAKFNAMPQAAKQRVIEQAVERKLLSAEAIKGGIEKDKEFQNTLKSVKSDLALEIWMKRVFEKIKVDDKAVKAYFDKNKDKFAKPASVKARHILLKTEKEAKDIIAQLKDLKGAALLSKFEELAKAKSVGPSGKNGGDLGWFGAKQMVAPFSNAAFALKKGEITKTPIKTQFGYHVIFSEDKKVGGTVTLDEAKIQITNGLKLEKFRKQVAAKAQELKKSAKIDIKKIK